MIKVFKCRRCGQEWASRQINPRACGVCKSTYWDRDYKSVKTREYGSKLHFKGTIIISKGS